MNYLSVENLTKSFGDRTIFQNLIFGIDKGQKVAIVAKNGQGKTTLLRCITGKESIDDGRIVFRKNLRVEFMQQSENLIGSNTILEEIYSYDLPEFKALKDYNYATRVQDEKLISSAFDAISELNAWDIETRVNQILSVLKFTDFNKFIDKLSGGQKKRVALAKVLIAEPDFLILDEPTNHLDLDMIEWLEDYFKVVLKRLPKPFTTFDYKTYYKPEDMKIIREIFEERFYNEFQYYGYQLA